MNTLSSAQQTALEQTKIAEKAQNDASQKAQFVEQMQGAMDFDSLLDKAQRQLVLAKAVLAIITTPHTLPKALADALPSDLDKILIKAESIIDTVRGLSSKDVAPDKMDELKKVVDTLTGATSPLSILLSKAAPLVAHVVPALGPVGGIVMLLGVGVKLGSDQFKRWRARVLAAPLAQGLVESGTLTLPLARAALERTPSLAHFFAARPPAEVDGVLANMLAADDPVTVLNDAYGRNGKVAVGTINEDEGTSIVSALQQSLLTIYSAGDITDEIASKVRASFVTPASQTLTVASAALHNLSAADISNLIDQVSGVSTMPEIPADSAASFDMLIMLVDTARRENIDLIKAIADLK